MIVPVVWKVQSGKDLWRSLMQASSQSMAKLRSVFNEVTQDSLNFACLQGWIPLLVQLVIQWGQPPTLSKSHSASPSPSWEGCEGHAAGGRNQTQRVLWLLVWTPEFFMPCSKRTAAVKYTISLEVRLLRGAGWLPCTQGIWRDQTEIAECLFQHFSPVTFWILFQRDFKNQFSFDTLILFQPLVWNISSDFIKIKQFSWLQMTP